MVNYVCAKTVPARFHQVVGPKSKFPGEHMPLDPPSLPYALHMDTYLAPPIIHTISFCPPPWAKKLNWMLFKSTCVLAVIVLVPDPKPTPAQIAFSIVHLILEAIYPPDEVWGRDYSCHMY